MTAAVGARTVGLGRDKLINTRFADQLTRLRACGRHPAASPRRRHPQPAQQETAKEGSDG
jgi:hypothetical protein